MSVQGLVHLLFYAWFWFLVWACGITAAIHFLLDFGVYFLLIEYLKSYFMVIGGIVVVLGFIALPATVTGISIIFGLILGFIYVYCLLLGMGEKPSPSGEDFSRFAILWNIIVKAPILFMTSRFTLYGSPNIANRSSLETWPCVCEI